jgi:NDP-hexose-3-ketoreductase
VVNIGVLGCADIAWRMVLPAIARASGVRLAAVASRDPLKAAKFADRFSCDAVVGYDALLERSDVDAVYVPLPNALHVPWALAAVKAGKHVLVEKPLAPSLAEARSLVELAETCGVVVVEGFMFLHHSQHRAVADLVAGGRIGEVREFEAVFGIPGLPSDNIRYDAALAGGALLDLGVYPLRAAQFFLGDVTLVGATSTVDLDRGVDVGGAMLVHAADGRIGRLAYGMQHGYRSTYSLWGSHGRITVDRAFTTPAAFAPAVELELPSGRTRLELAADDHFRAMVEDFAQVVRTGEHRHAEILRQAALVSAVQEFPNRW